ncbi:hypothetical protein DICVIV_08558 [Dictyocaulus viviparus]|uniref:Uncharacterized protein n=1 Tax=Dictyocaulus viviparus TaxID=29172 RepID=A0A0D8XSP3_DICVI|nr:hypothetical protein DICVIV_08558 [Dictyocaulus viviparus]
MCSSSHNDKVKFSYVVGNLAFISLQSPDKSPSNALPSSETCNNAGISQNTADNSMIDTCNVNAGTSSPKKRPLAPMTETLSNMIAEFKRCTNNLALPGQKKRLQNIHVDMVIAIEEQCLKDGYSLHEKARVAHSLADYCGIQKNSLYARCIKRRDEHKNGAPNLAFLAKSSLDGKRSTAIVPSSSSKPICLTLEQSSTSKTAGSSTLSANKSTSVQNPALSVPTRSNGPSQLPSTSAISSISSSSTAKTSMAPITSLSSTAIVQNPVTPSSGKSNQSWTSQKKLAAQAMITNVATLLPLNEHLGDIQEILKKVVNETITYEDFLKWHEKCKKSVSVKTNIDGKSGVNNVKNNLSSSSSNRITSSANAFSSELGVAVQSKSSASLSSSIAKRISLAQAMATAKLPPRTRPLSLSSAQISEKFESDKQMTLRGLKLVIFCIDRFRQEFFHPDFY